MASSRASRTLRTERGWAEERGHPRGEVEMRRIIGLLLVAIVASFGGAARAGQPSEFILSTPETVGDQLVFYYDARTDFTTFFTIRNTSEIELTVSVLFYGPTFSTPFSKAVT